MLFRVLGPLEVFDDDSSLVLESAKQRLLLAVLLCHRNHAVSVDRLIDVLWDGVPPKTCRTNLQVLVYRLRGVLGKHRIESGPAGYRLLVESGELDSEEFERLATNGSPAEALALWGTEQYAEPYAGLADHAVVRDEVARLLELRMATLEARIDADLSTGRSAQVIPELRTLVDGYPLRELLRCQLMIALYRSGRAAEALDVYRDVRQLLVDELGIEPGPELRQLQQAVLNEDPALDPPDPGADTGKRAPRQHVVPAELPPAGAAFTGRHTEVDRLLALLTRTDDEGSTVPVVAISGAGGIGKSALANHVAHQVAEQFPDGQLYVDLHGATPGTTPLEPVDVLGRFLRTLGVEDSQVPDDVDEAAGAFRSLTAGRRLLVVLDDADDAAQVRPLLPASAGSAVLLTSRRVLAALDDAVHVRLDGLSDDEAVVLLARLAGTDRVAAEPDAAAHIVRLCGWLPLAVRIAGARLAARPDWTLSALANRLDDTQRRLDELQHADLAVRSSLAVSHDALPDEAARLFDLLGLVDLPDICVPLSAAISDRTINQTWGTLDQLVESQLLMPIANDRHRFHDLVRLYARERAAVFDDSEREGVLRRVLHCYIATARKATLLLYLRTARRTDTGLPTEELVHPGIDLPDSRAAIAFVDNSRENLVALARRPGPAPELAALVSAIYMPLYVRGYWTDVISVSEVLLRLGEQHDEIGWRARANLDIGMACYRSNRYDEARAHLEAALGLYREGDDARGEANALNGLGLLYGVTHGPEQAIPQLQEAARVRREIGDREGEARVLNNIGDSYRVINRYDEAIPIFVACIAVYRELGERRSLGITLGNLGIALIRSGDPEQAIPHLEEALPLRRERGDRWGIASACWYLGEALHEVGKESEARACWREALDIIADLGRITAEEADAILAEAEPVMPEPLRSYG